MELLWQILTASAFSEWVAVKWFINVCGGVIDTHPYTPKYVCMTLGGEFLHCSCVQIWCLSPQIFVWGWGRPAGNWKKLEQTPGAAAAVLPRALSWFGVWSHMRVVNASLKWMQLLMKFVSPHRGVKGTLCSSAWRNARESHWAQACLDSRGSVCSELASAALTAQHQSSLDPQHSTTVFKVRKTRHFRLWFYESRNIFFYNIFGNEVAPLKEAITFVKMRCVLSQTSETVFICHCIKSTLQLQKFQFSLGKIRLLMTFGAVNSWLKCYHTNVFDGV